VKKKLLLFGTALGHDDEGYRPRRYNVANAYLDAAVRRAFAAEDVEVRRVDQRVDLVDGRYEGGDPMAEILDWEPDIVGLSCYVWDLAANMVLARRLKSLQTDLLLVAGGPEVGVLPQTVLEANPAVDVVVYGDGEETLIEILRAPRRDFSSIRGLVWRRGDGEIVDEGHREPVGDLSQVASPLLSGVLVPPEETLGFLFSRGCIHHCRHCAWNRRGGFRPLPSETIRKEIRWAVDHGYRRARLFDSAINTSTDRCFEVCAAFASEDAKGQLELAYFADHTRFEPRQVESLVTLRTSEIVLGIESANSKALKVLGRAPLDRAKFEETVRQLSAVCPLTVSIMLAIPGDDYDGFLDTIDYLASIAGPPSKPRIRIVFVNLTVVPRGSSLRMRVGASGVRIRAEGMPYVLGTPEFPAGDLLRALRAAREHPRRDVFWWDKVIVPVLERAAGVDSHMQTVP
jgi:anaerobic magnesium-protoporphyrin IX monomethyl ester cyclase